MGAKFRRHGISGGGAATGDHALLYNRNSLDQHVIESVSGLRDELDDLLAQDIDLETQIQNNDTDINNINSEISTLQNNTSTNATNISDNRQNINSNTNSITGLSQAINLYRLDDVIKVQTYNDIAGLINLVDGQLIQVLEPATDRKVYSWNHADQIARPISGGGGGAGGSNYIDEVHIVTYTGRRSFTLTKDFTPDSIEVYLDGVLVNGKQYDFLGNPLFNLDYQEVNPNQIVFNYDLQINSVLRFKSKGYIPIRKEFIMDNKNQLICKHELGTRFVNVTVWEGNTEKKDTVNTIVDDNNVLVESVQPITAIVVIQ